jgi:hypothetical protein
MLEDHTVFIYWLEKNKKHFVNLKTFITPPTTFFLTSLPISKTVKISFFVSCIISPLGMWDTKYPKKERRI